MITEQEIYFMPLGGGQRVGASCYYLRLGGVNIILDAGIGKEKGMVFEPDFHSLLTSVFIQSLSQINQIYISHAHADHIGYLLRLMRETPKADVYMTQITALLSEYQLYDKTYLSGRNEDENQRLADVIWFYIFLIFIIMFIIMYKADLLAVEGTRRSISRNRQLEWGKDFFWL